MQVHIVAFCLLNELQLCAAQSLSYGSLPFQSLIRVICVMFSSKSSGHEAPNPGLASSSLNIDVFQK